MIIQPTKNAFEVNWADSKWHRWVIKGLNIVQINKVIPDIPYNIFGAKIAKYVFELTRQVFAPKPYLCLIKLQGFPSKLVFRLPEQSIRY